MTGWIKLHRKYRENPRARDPHWVAVWCWILTEAAFEPGRRIIWKGKPRELKPGEFTAGRHQIAEQTGVNQSKVWRVLEQLKSEQQLEQEPGGKYSLFTVLKWHEYQSSEQLGEQEVSSNRAAGEQLVSTPKELKKERKEEVQPDFEEIYRAYPKKVAKPEALRAIAKAVAADGFDHVLKRTRLFGTVCNKPRQFVPNPSTFFNQRRYSDDPETWKDHADHSRNNPQSFDRGQGTCNADVVNDYAGR